jgi:amino acid transporter
LAQIGLYNTLLCTCSHIMYGMGQIGTLPECFTWLHPTRKTPYVAIGVLACSSYVMTLMPFTALAEVSVRRLLGSL